MSILCKRFTKNDLKDGMVVELRNGDRYLFVSDTLIGDTDYIDLNSRESLLSDWKNKFDIIKVFDVKSKYLRLHSNFKEIEDDCIIYNEYELEPIDTILNTSLEKCTVEDIRTFISVLNDAITDKSKDK